MIKIFYHVNIFDFMQTLTIRYPNGEEEYVTTTFIDTPEYLSEYIIKDNKEYIIYLSGLGENELVPIKEQILNEIKVYHGQEYAGVEVEII